MLRSRAAKALGTLITLTPRIDPLISGVCIELLKCRSLTNCIPELVTGARTADAGVKGSMLKALYQVVSKAGVNMGDSSKASILGLIVDEDLEEDGGRLTLIMQAFRRGY